MKSYRKLHKAASISLLVLAAITTRAEADPAQLIIMNPSDVPVTVSVVARNGDLQGTIGKNLQTILPGGEWELRTGRDSSKSGSVGRGTLFFSPSPKGAFAYMDVHGGNGVVILEQHSDRYPGTYYGREHPKHPGKNTYELAKEPPPRPTSFTWRELCSYPLCVGEQTIKSSHEKVLDESKDLQSEIEKKQSICADFSAGAVYVASTHACLESNNKVTRSEKLGQKVTKTVEESTVVIMPPYFNEAMSNYEVSSIWMYVELPNPGNGWSQQATYEETVHKNTFACPKGTSTPTYGREAIPQSDACTRIVPKSN